MDITIFVNIIFVFEFFSQVGAGLQRPLNQRRTSLKAHINMIWWNMPQPHWVLEICDWLLCSPKGKIWTNGWPLIVSWNIYFLYILFLFVLIEQINFISYLFFFSCWFFQSNQYALWHHHGILHRGELSHYVSWTKVRVSLGWWSYSEETHQMLSTQVHRLLDDLGAGSIRRRDSISI